MDTPFSFGKIVERPDFTDREKETAWLEQQVKAKNNCMIISPRTWGKSSLVQHAAQKIRAKNKNIIFINLDLYNIRSEQEFYENLSGEVLKMTSGSVDDLLKTTKAFFKKIIPRINVSPDPATELQVSFDWQEVKKSPSEILDLPESIARSKGKTLVVCLDEFQNISFFEDQLAFQKRLRAHWQKHKHTVYLLYGSKRHLLMEFFTKPSMPFYRFGEILFLEKIPMSYWVPYISDRFSNTGKKIKEQQASYIAELMENHPYFVQQMAQAVWLRTAKSCSDEIINQTLEDLLDQYSLLYQKEVDQLTNTQVNFLKAVVQGVAQLSANKILKAYRLGTSANVLRIKSALENKEIIDVDGKDINFNDPLFRAWLQKRYFR